MGPEVHELENMSPTFLEDPTSTERIFDTAMLSGKIVNYKLTSISRSTQLFCII